MQFQARVSVTRNESPGCRRDRCRTGREFAVRDLPGWCEGLSFYRSYRPGRLILSTMKRPGCSRTRVKVVGGYTKMTIGEASPADTPRCPPTACRAWVRRKRIDDVTVTVDLGPVESVGRVD